MADNEHAQGSQACHIARMRRVRAIVTGHVQGVGFRAFTVEEAREHGLTGWVRNLADGSVELEAQGDAARVDALLAWCGHGPPAAIVSGVTVEEREIAAGERSFEFRR